MFPLCHLTLSLLSVWPRIGTGYAYSQQGRDDDSDVISTDELPSLDEAPSGELFMFHLQGRQ